MRGMELARAEGSGSVYRSGMSRDSLPDGEYHWTLGAVSRNSADGSRDSGSVYDVPFRVDATPPNFELSVDGQCMNPDSSVFIARFAWGDSATPDIRAMRWQLEKSNGNDFSLVTAMPSLYDVTSKDFAVSWDKVPDRGSLQDGLYRVKALAIDYAAPNLDAYGFATQVVTKIVNNEVAPSDWEELDAYGSIFDGTLAPWEQLVQVDWMGFDMNVAYQVLLSLLLLASCTQNGSGSSEETEEVPAPEYGTVTDARGGREYRTVKIEKQWWMAENLDYAVDSSCCLNDEADSCLVYGRLYQWTAAMNLDTVYLTRNAKPDGLVKAPHQGICPDGWHVPSNLEFVKLYRYAEDFYGSEGVGASLKSESGWASGYGENPGTDKFGFNFKPGGMRIDDGTYWFDGQEDGVMMTSMEVGEKDHADIAYLWMFFYNSGVSSIDGSYTKRYAKSLRCIKD